MSLIDSIQIANDKFNIKYSKKGYASKVLTLDDIPNTAELYRKVFESLIQQKNEKFLHPMDKDSIEEIVTSKEQAILGYFNGQKLMGAVYTKPFGKSDPYFKTPSFDAEGKTYALGGFVVDPEFRGNGVITKLSNIIYSGTKEYSLKNQDENISGIGAEISSDNFNSLSSARLLKDEHGKPLLNFVGIHHIPNPQDGNIDLTVLGYNSFNNKPLELETAQNVVLTSNQDQNFIKLNNFLFNLNEQTSGITTTQVGDHSISTLNTYISAPYSDVLTLDKGQE